MSLQRKSDRQPRLVAILDIGFADPTAYGTAENAVSLPGNAIVVGGALTVLTPWNSATTATLSLGDAAVATRYANAVDLKTAARTALTLTGYKHTVGEWLKALIAQTGAAATAGAARLEVEYVVSGRGLSNQG
ncbi:hypothetical protein ABL850_15585 [Variovorax paradoxus]|jgi:hypothetical protein|uniref:hypothetical protein n=1 Tax=Variovorax paradoxus TaxID=34073 RepID=UPI000406E017